MADEGSIKKLVGSVLLCEAAGGIGSVLAREGLEEWYPRLEKPSFNPPDWVFGPVWTLLYALMGVSFYIAERRGVEEGARTAPRVFFGAQLALNVLWTYAFFGRRSPGWALVEITFLLFAVAATTWSF